MGAPDYGPLPEGVDLRWTSSSLESYLRCGVRFRMDRERHRWTTVPMAIGTAVHAGARADAVSKRDTGRGLRLPSLVEVSVQGYQDEVSRSEMDAGRAEIARGADDVARASMVYGRAIAPLIVPGAIKTVEEPLSMVLDMPGIETTVELAGTPDRIEGAGVGDTKTGREWKPATVRSARQLTVYGWLMYARFGAYPQFVFVDNVSRQGNEWAAQRVTSRRTDADYDAFYDLLVRATHARRLGVELPAPTQAWYCSAKWCPHWRNCPVVIGRRDVSK